jgi:hypothetical protein
VVPLTIGDQWNFAFFSSEEGLWNFVEHFAHGQQHPITEEPLTRDSIVVESSGSVAELLALCEHLYIDEAISGFYIDPDPPTSTTPTPMGLADIKDRIQAMAQEDSP